MLPVLPICASRKEKKISPNVLTAFKNIAVNFCNRTPLLDCRSWDLGLGLDLQNFLCFMLSLFCLAVFCSCVCFVRLCIVCLVFERALQCRYVDVYCWRKERVQFKAG